MKILKRITKSSFFKNIALLASGSIFAQVIVVLCSPLNDEIDLKWKK